MLNALRSYGDILQALILAAAVTVGLFALTSWLSPTVATELFSHPARVGLVVAALLAVIGFSELTQATKQAASTTKAFFTFFLAAMALYLAISLLSTFLIGKIEKWARRGQRDVRG